MLPLGILLTILGVIFTISPKASWWLANWWKVEGDVEPSSFSLTLYRLQGIIFIIVGIVVITLDK